MSASCHWVYILKCDNGSYYTGYTSDLVRRYQEHMMGTSKCKYTRSFKPLSIAQSWNIFENKSIAMKTEKYIKTMTRCEKEILIQHPEQIEKILAQIKEKLFFDKP